MKSSSIVLISILTISFLSIKYFLRYNLIFQIHWFSIFNSIMMVLFLVGLVIMILVRTVRADFLRFFPDETQDVILIAYFNFRMFSTLVMIKDGSKLDLMFLDLLLTLESSLRS